MFISKLEKEMINDRIDLVEEYVENLEERVADLEAIIKTLTDLFSVEINARVGKKCAELTENLANKLTDGLKELDNAIKDIVGENKKKTTKAEPKKTGRPKKESK